MKSHVTSLISIFPVKDLETSLAWYRKWLGDPDVIPMEGIAEYHVTETAWLQLSQEEGNPTSLVLGVDDIKKVQEELASNGLEPSDLMDWEVVLTCYIDDPDGNRISFAQEVL
ncbi:VOC family protein [Schaalia suimastitidis]|uniref:VOC family protein n=1 Tax=Schaalia suimastitidis TaxID=121163 RepID=UPI00040943A5|nr:VOC family protein [Schaalia suimastitidis]